MRNLYTLEAHKKGTRPVFVAAIQCELVSGIWFFKSLRESELFLLEQKDELTNLGIALDYDSSGEIWTEGMIALVKSVMENDDIVIGENGETYSKTMFPGGKKTKYRYYVYIADEKKRKSNCKIFEDESRAIQFKNECIRSGRTSKMIRKLVEF